MQTILNNRVQKVEMDTSPWLLTCCAYAINMFQNVQLRVRYMKLDHHAEEEEKGVNVRLY